MGLREDDEKQKHRRQKSTATATVGGGAVDLQKSAAGEVTKKGLVSCFFNLGFVIDE